MKRVIVSSCLFLATFLFFSPRVLAFEFNEQPHTIIIPSVNISLPVHLAKIQYNTWEVRTDGASFGEGSSLPGNSGNTVVFSHALPRLFGPLVTIRVGDTIHLFSQTDWFVYRVTEILEVNPEDIHVIHKATGKQLTLYTCTGEKYEKRHVVKAHLVATIH